MAADRPVVIQGADADLGSCHSGVLGLFLGCSGDGGQNCTVGTQFCLCFQGTCQVGLVCVNNYCLSPNDAETSGNPGDGDGDSGDGDGDGMSGDGDGDGDPGDGDGDGDGGDGDGDGGPGDGDGDPGQDGDNDGVSDNQDNCPLDFNPNQLDFDGNGDGNVCDILTFTNVSGSLSTNIAADAGIVGSCDVPATWTVTDGEVVVQLDDDASEARFEIVELVLANYNSNCMLLVPVIIAMTNSTIDAAGNPFPVGVAHSLAAHDNGSITGATSPTQPISYSGTLTLTINGMPGGSTPLVSDGALPVFNVNVTGGGASGTLSWAAPNSIIVADTFDVMDLPEPVNYEFYGLTGNLSLSP